MVRNMSEFYLTSRHGNCEGNLDDTVMFIAQNGNGYYTNLLIAHVFTLERAQEYHNEFNKILPLSKALVDEVAEMHVDCQPLYRFNPNEYKACPDEYVIQIDGNFCGNDIEFLTYEGGSFDLRKALVVTQKQADAMFTGHQSKRLVAWPKSYMETLARPTLRASQVDSISMSKEQGIELKPTCR